ncbi:nuclear transport factor 2 family protein [Jannaschia sp. CCS1]|uniref:nuclear transport factor 2 family protein n=1 Tax=Jannaschia sp. (strain CCS1) TaxID=290400 RepID=UPI000053D93F|nr:nuclear transport factor 2 family protein [Jannaschia sp. CCS1]ABD54466.1 hypothetical protein Jann_1549 [Jannaschia sp. CCS1]
MIPEYTQFARDWEAGWNAHDLDRIMAHYTEDVVFRSRKAVPHLGIGELRGKTQLRAYWSAALKQQPDLTFHVESILGGHDMMVIVYRNHREVLAAETVFFAANGLVEMASACHEDRADPAPYRITVDLWAVAGQEDAFAAFEQRALAAMARYGGKVIAINKPKTGPTERHVLQFPTRSAFDAYRNGPEATAQKADRVRCVAHTEINEVDPTQDGSEQ